MTKREVMIAAFVAVIFFALGGGVVKVQLMDGAIRNQAARLSVLENTTGQVVTFLNGVQQAGQQAQAEPEVQP